MGMTEACDVRVCALLLFRVIPTGKWRDWRLSPCYATSEHSKIGIARRGDRQLWPAVAVTAARRVYDTSPVLFLPWVDGCHEALVPVGIILRNRTKVAIALKKFDFFLRRLPSFDRLSIKGHSHNHIEPLDKCIVLAKQISLNKRNLHDCGSLVVGHIGDISNNQYSSAL